jgi:hypothetical protein
VLAAEPLGKIQVCVEEIYAITRKTSSMRSAIAQVAAEHGKDIQKEKAFLGPPDGVVDPIRHTAKHNVASPLIARTVCLVSSLVSGV